MALLRPHLHRFHSNALHHSAPHTKSIVDAGGGLVVYPTYGRRRRHRCSAIAIDAPSSLAGVTPIRWGYTSVQGFREEMEDDIVIRSEALDGFSFAAVFDGHAGSSSVKFLREELYKGCVEALQVGSLLKGGDFGAIKGALVEAFESVDQSLLKWLETKGEEDESGSTATVMLIRNDVSYFAHIGDSCAVLSRSGKIEELTDSHRPYGSSKAAVQEMKRIKDAGGWIVNGRICGDIAVSRAFGDIRFKTKKHELRSFSFLTIALLFKMLSHCSLYIVHEHRMLKKGVDEGRWSEKFVSRIEFKGDMVVATPDIYQVPLTSDVEFIILASDGLWDYMKSKDVVSFVREQLREHGNLACEALAQVALDRRSEDNISIIIADLGRTEWKKLPVQRQNMVVELVQAAATVGIVTVCIWMTSLLS
uniref:protein-serine/threonine phosphatase n=1 Tax=Brassica oleracea var. oleracea TaxID=109376 RepID=A0A0D3DGG5_BRAOL